MVTPVDIIGGIAGYTAGATYQFLSSTVAAVTSGDFAEIKRLIMTLALVWIGFIVVLRSLNMIWGVVKLAIKLTVLVGCLVLALSIYHDGLDQTLANAAQYGSRLLDQLGDAAKVHGHSALKLLHSEYGHVVSAVQELKQEYL